METSPENQNLIPFVPDEDMELVEQALREVIDVAVVEPDRGETHCHSPVPRQRET